MKKKSDIFERIDFFMTAKGFKNLPELAHFLQLTNPETLYRLKRSEKNKPSYALLVKIAEKFEELDMNWLIRGTGTMELKKQAEDAVTTAKTDQPVAHAMQQLISALSNEINKPVPEGLEKIKLQIAMLTNLNGEMKDKIDYIYDVLTKAELFKEIRETLDKTKHPL